MSCSNCGTGKDGTPSGCRSNGTCGTDGCNKLNVYNWLSDMVLPSGQSPFPIIEVRFKGSRKEFFYNKDNVEVRTGDVVTVEASPGHDVGIISMIGELVRFQLRKKNVSDNPEGLKMLYRKAKENEIEKWNEVKNKETDTLHRARKIIQSLKLSMKLSDIEYQGDGKKATFFYTADDRVDFRELIKRLADEFKIRVEMKQIGMRQEAGRLGGIGVCGRELCCSTWLTDFKTVTTSAARYQNLALNPAKLAGQCTKLKCCLNYELDSYLDALRDFPSTNAILETEKGRAFHRKSDIFKRLVWYAVSGEERREQSEGADGGGDGGNWVMLSVDRVKEIIELNKKGIKPTDLKLPGEDIEIAEPDYENVVGQDRIDRMDRLKKKKKKKKKKPSSGERPVADGNQPAQNTNAPAQQSDQQRRNPPAQNQPRVNPPRVSPPNSNPPRQNPTSQNPPRQNPPRTDPPRTNPPSANPPSANPPRVSPPNSNSPKPNQPNQNRPQHNRRRPPQNQPRRDNDKPPQGNGPAPDANS